MWCRSTHSKKIDATLNDTVRIGTGHLHPTPTNFLPVQEDIALASLRREKATHCLSQQAVLDENYALNHTEAQPSKRQRLKSRHAAALEKCNFGILEA